jgi:ABC-type multidrug transport system fused ATPase/permease subunit
MSGETDSSLIEMVNILLPVMVMVASFAGYTLVQKKHLTAATVFTSMTVFEILKGQMMMGFYMVSEWITAGVSMQRLNKFMNESEMIDAYSQGNRIAVNTPEKIEAEKEGLIRIKDAVFAWGTDSPDKNVINFRLRVPDVTFSKGKINLVCGPTGSGKSSLLAALIGELHFEPENDTSFFHLPRDGGVSFAAQESWCTSASIRENILFGKPYERARYRKVLHDCALETDLKLFDDGDETEIGEKGITLSGGQKARVTLARAIYSGSAIVLLDDIFSALDTLTSRFILDNLFKGDLVKDRTVVLVTHHTHLAGPIADYMVTLDTDGSVAHAGPIDASMISAAPSESDLSSLRKTTEMDAERTAAPTPDEDDNDEAEEQNGNGHAKKPSKLIKDEEKSEGRISRRALKSFFSMFGGPVFWSIYFGLLFAGQVMASFQTWWLGRWARAYDEVPDPDMVSVPFWLGLYMAWVVIGILGLGVSAILFYIGAMKASRVVHQKLVDHIFGAYMRFIDTTPVGRIISRFTKDMRSIDGPFTELAVGVFDISMGLIIKLVTIVLFVPFFSIPAIVIGVLGGFIGEMYIHAQLSVKREMSNAKSPLFSHLASSVSGIVSIRAYGAQEQIKNQTREKADKYTRTATAFYNLNRWVTVRIDMLGGLFSMTLAIFLVYVVRLDPSTSGFALTQAISFAGTILWWVRMLNDMEVQGNSVERIEDYLVIDQEPKYEQRRATPAAWPSSGEIAFEGLSAKYSKDGPTVLDNLTFTIKSGEKVGIVGRTGSGKSTLALALLRMVPTTGTVIIDGKETDKINLHDLRTNVTIIPQDPILLSGTLRFNLDPFGERQDAELNDALDRSGLGAAARAPSGGATPMRITLDTQIAAGGSNLSQGQRQLVALARALVRRSKVLILDEATASVDFATDALIQKSIRDLPSDTTVLTVAHRLATVMDYDKILVLGAGKVLEFDSPNVLKDDKDSYFAKLVQAMDS